MSTRADTITAVRQVCHCGHDLTSHYADEKGEHHNCLCMGCDCNHFMWGNNPYTVDHHRKRNKQPTVPLDKPREVFAWSCDGGPACRCFVR